MSINGIESIEVVNQIFNNYFECKRNKNIITSKLNRQDPSQIPIFEFHNRKFLHQLF